MEITLVQGDITTQDVDAIVNAANSGLLGGGGVDGAILATGGDAQLAGRRELRERIGPLPTGQAAASVAGAMAARWVIHTVGPVYAASADPAGELASCYRSCLRVADELAVRTLAFPSISTGVYGYPLAEAAPIAVRAVREGATRVAEVRFVLFNQQAYDAFADALGAP